MKKELSYANSGYSFSQSIEENFCFGPIDRTKRKEEEEEEQRFA